MLPSLGYKKYLIAPIMALVLFASWVAAAPSPDAIGIRIAPNPKHYSALRWYRSQNFKGSPQALIVDGYQAIRDGRTVYINAANIKDLDSSKTLTNADEFYTNIFIISYNQNAEKATEDIFGQILSNWKFNSNILTAGLCDVTATQSCVYTSSCPVSEYCLSSHDISVRDTRRLADLNTLNELLEQYKKSHKGYCPILQSGTYVPNHTVSTWPSWQETLGKAFGSTLPIDPINKLGACPGYNSQTCWDEVGRKFADPTPANNVFDLPNGSYAYVYYASKDGLACSFTSDTESQLDCNAFGLCKPGASVTTHFDFVINSVNSAPAVTCGQLVGFPHSVFRGYLSAFDPDAGDNNHLTWTLNTGGTTWTNWSAPPSLRPVVNIATQKELYATQGGDKGNYNFSVTVSDSKGSSTSRTCSISLGATIPYIYPIEDQTVFAGEKIRALTVFASEPSKEYPLTFDFTAVDSGGASYNNFIKCDATSSPFGEVNGQFNCYIDKETIDHPGGVFTVTVVAKDSNGDTSVPEQFQLTIINTPPSFVPTTTTLLASTSIAINNKLLWEATDLLSNFPFSYSVFSGTLPSGITFATATVLKTGLSVSYTYGTTTVVSSVNGSVLQYLISGSLDTSNVFSAAQTDLNYSVSVADKYGLSANGNYTISVLNNPPVIAPVTCPTVMRANSAYNCTINTSDQEGNLIHYNIGGVPGGLVASQNNTTANVSGTPPLASVGNHVITFTPIDEFDYVGAMTSHNLRINNYCGDGIVETPNTEGLNGPANNGMEDCEDGNVNDTDACNNNCTWTIKTEPYDLAGSNGDAVVYDNNNNPGSATAMPGGTYIKIQGIMPTPYIWVAQSTANTIKKIRAFTGNRRSCSRDIFGNVTCYYDGTIETRGQDLGTYPLDNPATAPVEGLNPSRTAVNAETGDVWVGGRDSASITKLDNQGNILKACPAPAGTRGVAIAQNGDVWVGGSASDQLWRIPGDDTNCAPIVTISGLGSVYGLAIDSDDNVWSANAAHTAMIKSDTVSNTVVSVHPATWVYGITVDPFGNAWGGGYQSGGFFKVDKTAAVNSVAQHFTPPGNQVLGLTTDIYGNIWGAGYTSGVAVKVSNSGVPQFTGAYGWADSHGMCGDSSGQVWEVYYQGFAKVYDGATNVELEPAVNVGSPNGTYTYSDMTGLNRAMALRSGTWHKYFDGLYQNQHWGVLHYDQIIPSAQQTVDVFIRANNNYGALASTPWLTAAAWNALPMTSRVGQHMEIKILMRSRQPGVTPVVWNVRVE
ncbi:hypothetical protein HGA64_00515 [Candidatus Falkowbacteria bacterium]|nr:hypothetical protein [Candidatus Falkowbacteria bacterium]